MATLQENRDERANAILSYYNNLQTYNTQTDADGDDIIASKPQAKFKAFNDLIKLHHDELNDVIGYASASQAYLPSAEGAIDTTEWWYNANNIDLRASMFSSDSVYLLNRNALYMANSLIVPNQRHPYAYWNQYNAAFGNFSDYGFVNATLDFTYTNTQNPFEAGANYRLREPLESYGDDNNLLWGRIVHNGRWAYRSVYCTDASFVTVADTGFNNYSSTGKPIGNFTSAQSTTNVWPSLFEIMRYTYWGTTGFNNEGSPASRTISSHSGTSSGTFTVTTTGQFTPNTWYIFYHSSTTTQGWVLLVGTETDLSGVGTGPFQWTYSGAYWPVPGNLDGTRQCATNPTILGTAKTSPPSNGRQNVWNSIYNQYYSGTGIYPSGKTSTFKNTADVISAQVVVWSTDLFNIYNFNYTIINQEAGSNIGKSEANTVRGNIVTWLNNWKTLVNDTGSGATYTQNDAKWSDVNLDTLFTNGTGGLNLMIAFAGGVYTGVQTGYIASRRTQIYNSILGKYNLAADEQWNADLENFPKNNTGYLDTGKLYWYRHNYIDSRLNRENGTISVARNAYYTYQAKLVEIVALQTQMSPLSPDSEYDVTPFGFDLTQDEEEKIIIDWEDIKAAASYDIQRKTGLSGSWATIAANFGYVNPGTPPDFTSVPPSIYEDPAVTRGYQEFGLSFANADTSTGLNSDFTIYDFGLNLDGSGSINIQIKGLDAVTFEALRVSIQNELNDLTLAATVEIISNDIRITSNKRGVGSTIAITLGTSNDLLAALSTTLDTAIAGTTQIEQGKAYYYRVKVNNGYNVVLGGGTSLSKDWNSQSMWQTDEYSGARATNGDVGVVVWDQPQNLKASGVDPGITVSDLHCRLEWDAAPNAASYRIYRATSLDGGYAYIASTTNTYYEDTAGVSGFVYFYKLKAVANSDYQIYDTSGNLSGPIESLLTDEGVRGKKLWQSITLEATRDNEEETTLTWNTLSGANGYLVYIAPIENGQYSSLTQDDGTELVITTNSYVDARSAKQFFENNFISPTDGIADGDYESDSRYYFVLVCSDSAFQPTVRQYYITSPSLGIWTAQAITNSIQTALVGGLNNAICELVLLTNPSIYYKIRIRSLVVGVDASLAIQPGTFGTSLLSLLLVTSAEPGEGAYLAVDTFYKVQAVEVIAGEIVRSSELSNLAIGLRPIQIDLTP